MHFAFPPRKTSHPPPYALRSPPSKPFAVLRRNGRLQSLAILAVGAIGFFWLVYHILFAAAGGVGASSGLARPVDGRRYGAVIVTVFDGETSEAHEAAIKENRRDYASRHGYTTFFTNTTTYTLARNTPKSWSILPSLRHAMTLHPTTPYVFYLAPTALIMSPTLSLESHIMAPSRLESIMQVDRPVVPPDSVIKTFAHVKGSNVDFVLTQDSKGLSQHSMVLRSGDWAKYLLDAWFDPLYRSYNFQKAERHALEHIVQWHGTILARLALVPQRTMNSYTDVDGEGRYAEGDFIANFVECEKRPIEPAQPTPGSKRKPVPKFKNMCEEEMQPLLTRWREMVDREGRGKGRVGDSP